MKSQPKRKSEPIDCRHP